jgi:glyoxylase-like metal-dependent hydrolase (beta-lactamase superfamily II)
MWLPEERVLASGDQVVGPTPYGGRSYPREWAGILRKVSAFDFEVLVPGHGEVLRDRAYLDLLVETLESVAEQTRTGVEAGLTQAEAAAALDLSAVKDRFTGGDPFLARRFDEWFHRPVAFAAYNEATGQPNEILERPEEDADR